MTEPKAKKGTTVTFKLLQNEYKDAKALKETVNDACRYSKISTYYNGRSLEQVNLLRDAKYVEQWQGLQIGVAKGSLLSSSFSYCSWRPILNFYGLPLDSKSVTLADSTSDLSGFHTLVDVVDCPKLKLVLPARKEVVQNRFFRDLKKECQRVIYRYIQTLNGHSLPYKCWLQAKQLGVKLPEADRTLKVFCPTDPNNGYSIYDDDYKPGRVLVQSEGVIVDCFSCNDTTSALEQCFYKASKGSQTLKGNLFEADKLMEGYSWYDTLGRITSVTFKPVGEQTEKEGDIVAEQINMALTVTEGKEERFLELPASIWIDTEYPDLDEATIVLSKCHKFDVSSLTEFLTDSLFFFNENYDQDSEETQKADFVYEATYRATALLFSQDEARIESIERALRQHIQWQVPDNLKASIEISKEELSVVLSEK